MSETAVMSQVIRNLGIGVSLMDTPEKIMIVCARLSHNLYYG